jgi:DNA-directed RNA polymerase subunit RPC12/RpoP
MKRNYKYNIGDKVFCNDGVSYNLILEQTKGKRGQSAYICQCQNGHVYNKLQEKIHGRCPYCLNMIIERGINDISTTNPEMFSMLVDKNFGYTHCDTSQENTNFKCPTCKRIINTRPYSVKYKGLSCPNCSDGISYGEKFIANLLDELGINYITQYSVKTAKWCGKFRYDFYLPQKDTIIEVMGIQHYQDTPFGTYEDIHKNDLEKEKLARNYVSNYIVVDARYSTMKYLKQSILRGDVYDVLELWNSAIYIPWKKIHYKSTTSLFKSIIDYYNNQTKDLNKIVEKFHVARGTVVRYLNNATELGLCDYNGETILKQTLIDNHKRNTERCSKPVMCIDDGNVFKSATYCQEISDEVYGVHLNNVIPTCKGKQKSCKKKHFKYITRTEFNNIKINNPERAYGDLFENLELV